MRYENSRIRLVYSGFFRNVCVEESVRADCGGVMYLDKIAAVLADNCDVIKCTPCWTVI